MTFGSAFLQQLKNNKTVTDWLQSCCTKEACFYISGKDIFQTSINLFILLYKLLVECFIVLIITKLSYVSIDNVCRPNAIKYLTLMFSIRVELSERLKLKENLFVESQLIKVLLQKKSVA
jgi:hypothetical protein